jgi:phosphotransacetylase
MEESDQQNASTQEVDQTQTESTSVEKEFVPVKAFKEVSTDMHKFKNRAREAEAKATELAERIKAIEENELKAKQEYQTLYEREKAAKEAIEAERLQEKELYLRSVKVSALRNELGGKVNDQYLSFANIDSIELKEDGTLNSESVQSVANSFRQEHPGLIAKDSSVNITGSAPANGVITEQPAKTIDQLSTDQKVALLLDKKQNRS